MQQLFLLLILLLSTPASADIYKYIDDKGQLYMTDIPQNSFKLLSVYRPHLTKQSNSSYNPEKYTLNKQKYLPQIYAAAQQYSIEPLLLQAIVDVESAFNPKALSKTGATGLMQLMPETAKDLGVTDIWDPQQNISAGAKYLRQLLDTFQNNIRLSIAAYNAGPNAVKRAGNQVPNYSETKRYVTKVLDKYKVLQAF